MKSEELVQEIFLVVELICEKCDYGAAFKDFILIEAANANQQGIKRLPLKTREALKKFGYDRVCPEEWRRLAEESYAIICPNCGHLGEYIPPQKGASVH